MRPERTRCCRGPAQAWQDLSPGAQRVTKRAQELFLEVAHYLPEKGAQAVVLRLQQAVQDALGDVGLDQPLTSAQVLDCLSAVHAGEQLQLKQVRTQLQRSLQRLPDACTAALSVCPAVRLKRSQLLTSILLLPACHHWESLLHCQLRVLARQAPLLNELSVRRV